MSWRIHHANSEQYASQAEAALRQRDTARATALYRQAAEEETAALAALDPAKPRTLGITAVSAASLWYKAHELAEAEHVAYQWIATKLLPPFAVEQLRTLLQTVWAERAQHQAGRQGGAGSGARLS